MLGNFHKCSAIADSADSLATIDMGRKLGELGPHVTQCRLSRGLPPTRWHLDQSSRLATTDMERKFWGRAVPL